jgi:hypothetical protein
MNDLEFNDADARLTYALSGGDKPTLKVLPIAGGQTLEPALVKLNFPSLDRAKQFLTSGRDAFAHLLVVLEQPTDLPED